MKKVAIYSFFVDKGGVALIFIMLCYCHVPPLVVLVQLDVLPSLVVDHPDKAAVRL